MIANPCEMQKDFRVCLVKASLLWSLPFLFVKDASSASYPQCHIMGKLADCPNNEETVDPNSIVPVNCSIRSGGTSNQNTTWKRVYDLETPKKCLVLKTENSETRIYLARELEIKIIFNSVEIGKNKGRKLSCEFTGRPRPEIVWDKDNNPIANKAVITEQDTQKNDVLITTSTLSIPGRPEFRGLYTCSATSRLESGWLSTKNDTIEVLFSCPTRKIKVNGTWHVERNAFENITISCFVNEQAEKGCDAFAWHFKNKTLKTDGKYITQFKDTEDYCKKVLKLEIINATENDEGEYRCQQSKCMFQSWESSDKIEININVRPPNPPSPENKPRNSNRNSTELTADYMGDVVENEKVFISYSSKDFSWVTENLVSPLEKHSIPYSIHNRDFELGRPIVQNMADSVFNSRQVLIVLSNNYLASNFCREELQMALEGGRQEGFRRDSCDYRQVEENAIAKCIEKKKLAGFREASEEARLGEEVD